MRRPYWLISFQHVRNRPVRSLLTVAGVAVGISAAIALQLSNDEVLRAFQKSVTTVSGDVDLVVSAGDIGLEEDEIRNIRHQPGVAKASPVLREVAVVLDAPSRQRAALVLWGLDLVDEAGRVDVLAVTNSQSGMQWEALLAPDSLFVPRGFAETLGWAIGQTVTLGIGGQRIPLTVRGFINPEHRAMRRDEPVALMDIAAMQQALGLLGRLHRIHVTITPQTSVEAVLMQLTKMLSPHLRVSRPTQRNQQIERMIHTFQMNLLTLSLVGLLIGCFLVYNTVAFSVIQYRREIGLLRVIGFSRGQVATLFVAEAAALGLCGGVFGAALGEWLSEYLVVLVSQSVSELYAPVLTEPPDGGASWYVLGGALGTGMAILGALGPALQASRIAPVIALAPGTHEEYMQHSLHAYGWCAIALFGLAGLFTIPGPQAGLPIWGYVSAMCLLLGCAALGPLIVHVVAWISPLAGRGMRRVALDNLQRTPGRNGVTLAALMVGVAIIVGVGVMVQSFRATVEQWIDQTIMADVIVAPLSWLGGLEEGLRGNQLPMNLMDKVTAVSGVQAVDPYRQVRLQLRDREIYLVSRDLDLHARKSRYQFMHGVSDQILHQAKINGGVVISEVLANSLGVREGEWISLPAPDGETRFRVEGIFYDYATDGGKVVMDRGLFTKIWGDPGATVLAVYADPAVDREALRQRLKQAVGPEQPTVMIRNEELREEILRIFDRTFRVTHGLELIALVVAFLGIVNTLVTSILERQCELSTLRAIGASAGQLRTMIVWEAGWLGAFGAVLGLLGGLLLAVLLIAVINKQSFGWTIQFTLPAGILLQGITVALSAAVLGALVPAYWASRQPIVDGLRYE